MRWVAVLVTVSGCNEILGIDKSLLVDAQLIDARQFDSPLDAPYACPPIGTAPQFARVFHQVTTRSCEDISISTTANRAMALCTDTNGGIVEGTLDGELTAATGFEPIGLATFDQVRLTPEGDEVFIRVREDLNTRLAVYGRNATAWTFRETIPLSLAGSDYLAGVTRAPARRAFVWDATVLHEYRSDDPGGWTETASYTAADLGLIVVVFPRVTGDGLRMVMTGLSMPNETTGLFYSDRADVLSRFGPAVRLSTLPQALYASIADDCSRLYFSSLETVFYVQQP